MPPTKRDCFGKALENASRVVMSVSFLVFAGSGDDLERKRKGWIPCGEDAGRAIEEIPFAEVHFPREGEVRNL